ncbi:MAG: GspE/PulE family protein [Candidatus Pacebacteria bacterium]|nr:GspE/PulE family protein [Candidatus Paceibacterota bacterium]
METPTEITKQTEINQETIHELQKTIKDIACLTDFLSKNLSKDISKLMEVILTASIILEASDIHFEPEQKKVKFRLRIDGILHDIFFFEIADYKAILSRIKLLSGIMLNITDKAQDGRFTILFNQKPIETRVSSLPSEYGETIVMRILDPKSLIEAEKLGIRQDMIEIFEKEIRQPNGMIIVTGPTGSGKTTTLYAILKKIQNPEIKIITIEDPIEYHLEGISQSQVNPKKGYSFVTGLEAIVRQDPDVILVGEIRDFETAQIALQASLTGHLVLTTLHTNDATGTIVRLMALGEKPNNIAPALNLAIGQRLIRKICPSCQQEKQATEKELTRIKKETEALPKDVKEKIKLPIIGPSLKIPKPRGCQKCNNTGYKGRIGIFEFFLNDDEMEGFIAKSPNIAELKQKAKEKGMATMKQDGIIKVLQGITSLEEVEKATGE